MKKKKGYSKDTPVSDRHRARPGTRRIFGLAKQLGIEIDDIRGMAKDISGIASISQLTNHQANELIRKLGQKIKQVNKLRNTEWAMRNKKQPTASNQQPVAWPKGVTWLISPDQKKLILDLLTELGWSFDSLLSWLPKQFNFNHPGNRSQAHQVINRLIALRRSDLNRARP